MKTVLLCHHDDILNRAALPRWLGSFSDVVGIVVIQEGPQPTRQRIKRELKRIGYLRFLDVLAYRLYHRLRLRARDQQYESDLVERINRRYAPLPDTLPTVTTPSPNSVATREFLTRLAPDLVIARCKVILKPEIFEVPRLGTYVMHPGICPEYRNAHGCFWALAQHDLDKVGMTLLKVDAGIDTGPVYGYFRSAYDERTESHITIQHRTVFDNLDAIRDRLTEIARGTAVPLDTRGRASGVWGQPWLTKYAAWKRAAKRRAAGPGTDAGTAA